MPANLSTAIIYAIVIMTTIYQAKILPKSSSKRKTYPPKRSNREIIVSSDH